jgi:hypothetical protein
MTTQPADEDILIKAARAERAQHRSGASMFAMLGVAVAFGLVGGLLLFVPHLVSMLLPGPFRLLGIFAMPVSLTLGVVALGIGAFFLLAAFASSPMAAWGNKAPGDCPSCGEPKLRSDTVPSGTPSGNAKDAPRGIVTLCETRGCDYASARVTRASGATSI